MGSAQQSQEFDIKTNTFQIPQKTIITQPDVDLFFASPDCKSLIEFVRALAESVRNTRYTETQLTKVSMNIH